MKKSTKVILGAAGAAAAANCVHAATFKPAKKEIVSFSPETVDVEHACESISAAVQIKTVSYPDEEMIDFGEFDRFHKFLEERYPLIHKTLEKENVARASLIYKWKGKNPALEPIALLSHQDVVPISDGTLDDWVHEPFSGYNDGEFIWGRGTLDMKNHLICLMESVESLIAEGFEPERDVYLCFGHDEEIADSENSGAKIIAELLRDRGIRLDSVLDEGGAILPVNIKGIINAHIAGIGIAEKGYADFEITVETVGGHSSQPPKHSGLGELAQQIQRLENNQFKAEMMPFLKSLFENLGRRVSYPARLVTCNIKLLYPVLLNVLKQIPPAASLIRTTTAVTMASGSPAANVLPQRSSFIANFRAMPGTTTQDIENHIKKTVKGKNVTVKCLKKKEASNFSPTDSRAFKVIEDITNAEIDDAVVAPYLVMGGTDACFYEIISDNVYRYSPFAVNTELLLCTHSTNERLPVSSVDSALRFFKRYIRTLSES